jgi:leucyl aminopeptidase
VALVGKGLTFDTGGLDIKSAASMRTMKVDMAGAAVVLAAALAAGKLGLSTPVRAILACAENMLGPAALHPGDIVTHRNGLTCEIVDTDSEGRLVLADAISYAVDERPRHVVSVATLTGAASLGNEIWAVLGNNSALNRDILAAAAQVGEAGWEMPIVDAYRSYLVSPVADLKNFYDDGVKWTFGAILAALYLREFADGVDWVHLDICATAVHDENEWWAHGATGSGTSTVIRHLQRVDEGTGQS